MCDIYYLRLIPLRYFSETPTFYQNYIAMRNSADVTGGKPIAIRSQSISVVSAFNPLVAFYDIHGRKGEVLFILSRTPHETRTKCDSEIVVSLS
jgi:hypothetical protein